MRSHQDLNKMLKKSLRGLSVSGALALAVAFSTPFASVLAHATVPGQDAEKMDVETHGFLIQKLEDVIDQTPKGDGTRVPALLRIADLLSERARLMAMEEVERGCFDESRFTKENEAELKAFCARSSQDRKKAISYYEMALRESSGANQSRILFHLAHLYELNQDNRKAESMYRRILGLGSKHFSQAVLGQSQAGLAEIAFREKHFADAKRGFEQALKNPATPRKGWIHYRIAWSQLNLGQSQAGKERLLMVLKTPSLLTLESSLNSQAGKPDTSFQEDIARDLTVFFARTGFDRKDIEQLWALSPEIARKDIMSTLADEAERLGQRRSAIDVWTVLATRAQGLSNREKTEALVRVASLRFGIGEKARAVSDYRTAVEQWKKGGCDPLAECELLQKRFRKLVLDWNKNEETKLTASLLDMYKAYVSAFPADPEMAFWGATVARSIGPKYRTDAMKLYRTASMEASKIMSSSKQETWDKNLVSVFEGSLLSEIELAEETKDLNARESAYRHYLAMNPKGAKSLEVRYQIAHVTYTRGETAKAADMFFELAARDENCREKNSPSFCRQAADLALDAVALQKNDSRLEAMGEELAKLYPQAATEYLGVSRRARLNIAAKAAGSGRNAEMEENLERLKKLSLKGASNEEVLLTYQNRFVLAEKTRNFEEANAAAVAVINFKGASEKQREDAMAKRLWVAEMQLDFPTAYITARQMKHSGLSQAERELRLSLLAELAGRDAKPHLRQFIRLSKDRKAVLAARVNLVKLSGFSERELMAHLSELRNQPGLVASLGLEVYSRHPSTRLSNRLLAIKGVAKTEEGSVLVRSREIGKISTWAHKLAGAKLPVGASDRTLSRAIQLRIQALNQADQFANSMIKTGDAWLQALALQAVSNENRRLKDEILSLPVPKGLKESDLKRYQILVQKQVQPFEVKAVRVADKVQKFWRMNPAESFGLAIEKTDGAKRQFLAKEGQKLAQALNAVGQTDSAKRIVLALESDQQAVRVAAIERARRSVKDDPFDIENIRRLRDLEAKAGSETMVAYLDSRMSRMGVKP